MEGIILFQDKCMQDLEDTKKQMKNLKEYYDKKISRLEKKIKHLDKNKLDLQTAISNIMSKDGLKYESFVLNQLYERIIKLEEKLEYST